MVYAGAQFWDRFYRQRRGSGRDLDWAGLWTRPFLVPLREAGARTVLELGCRTGNNAARLAGADYSVTGIDLSGEAMGQAQARFGLTARFMVADMTRPLRARSLPARELEPDYVAEESGQTVHFFS